MGPARQQAALYQRQRPPGLQGLIERHGGLAAGDGAAVEGDLLFDLILQKKALDLPLGRLGTAHGDAEVGFFDLVIPDLLVEDAQRLGVFGGDDDAAGVAVDAVAKGRGKGVFPPGVPLPLLVEIGLDVVDEGIDLLRLVGVDHHAGALVHQQQILILVDDVQPGLEHCQEHVFLRGLVKELVIDI